MDSERAQVVNLEVSVPRIILSTGRGRQAQMKELEKAGQAGDGGQDGGLEEVRLLPLAFQEDTQRRGEQQGLRGEASTRMAHTLHFTLFRMSIAVPMQGQSFLFQVLRKYNEYAGKKRGKWNNAQEDGEQAQQAYVTDASSFSVAFRQLEGTTSTLTPGLNQIVIFLDNEGIPVSYSIDGAES